MAKSNVIPFNPLVVIPRATSPPPEWVRVDIKLIGRCWQPFCSTRYEMLTATIEGAYELWGSVELPSGKGLVRAVIEKR